MEIAWPLRVELHHAIALRVVDVIAEDGRAALEVGKGLVKAVAAVEDVVAEDQRDRVLADEALGDQKRLGDALRLGLLAIINGQPPGAAVAEQLPEARQILRRGDQAELPDAALDQRRQRVIHHRFVIDRLELLARHQGQREQPRTGAAGQDYAFH